MSLLDSLPLSLVLPLSASESHGLEETWTVDPILTKSLLIDDRTIECSEHAEIVYAIMPKGGELTWLCWLYRPEDSFPHFVILTREPGESIAFIHDRMPFILPESKVDTWIDPERNPHMLLGSAV